MSTSSRASARRSWRPSAVPAEPPHRRALEPQRVIIPGEQDEAECVGEVDVAEFGSGGEREVSVPGFERARAVGVRPLHTTKPTVVLHPCPVCRNHDAFGLAGIRFTALAVWDGFGVILTCNGCGGDQVADVLTAGERRSLTPDELERWHEIIERRLRDPLPPRGEAVAS
jgi:hypothetical protein